MSETRTLENGLIVVCVDGGDIYKLAVPADLTTSGLSLADVRIAKKSMMDTAYTTATNADVTYDSVVYQSGDTTRQNLSEAIANYVSSANALPSPFTWRAKDNSDVAFTTTDIKALAALVGTQKTVAIYNLQAKNDAIDAAADIAAVNAITWS